MKAWARDNKAAINKYGMANELQVSSWAIVVTITTKENEATTPVGATGWGYIHPPVNIHKTTGNTPNDWDTETMYACMPNNWDQWSGWTGYEPAPFNGNPIYYDGIEDLFGFGPSTGSNVSFDFETVGVPVFGSAEYIA